MPRRQRRATAALTLGGLLVSTVGLYGVLDATTPPLMGTPTLVAGLALSLAGLWAGGRRATATSYRPDPWRLPEWLTLACGLVAAAAFVLLSRTAPETLTMPLQPLGVPALPLLGVAGLLIAALPAVLTPAPPPPASRRPVRGAHRVVARA